MASETYQVTLLCYCVTWDSGWGGQLGGAGVWKITNSVELTCDYLLFMFLVPTGVGVGLGGSFSTQDTISSDFACESCPNRKLQTPQ